MSEYLRAEEESAREEAGSLTAGGGRDTLSHVPLWPRAPVEQGLRQVQCPSCQGKRPHVPRSVEQWRALGGTHMGCGQGRSVWEQSLYLTPEREETRRLELLD